MYETQNNQSNLGEKKEQSWETYTPECKTTTK